MGKCQGELKVSVRARCCSAMTRLEMRCARIRHMMGLRVHKGQMAYRSQHGVHKFICLVGLHEAAHLQDANGQPRYHSRMLLERIFEYLTIPIIILERADLGNATKALEGSKIELVHVGEMGVCNNNIRQRLHVAQTVRDPTAPQYHCYTGFNVRACGTLWAARVCSSWPSRATATPSSSGQRRSAVAG